MRIPFAFLKSASAAAAPTVSSISPNVADTAGGGGIVTITGANLTGATGVTLGGTAATSVTVVSSTTVTCVPGARAAAASLSVVVTTGGGSNAANTLFEYWTPAQISNIDFYVDANKGVTASAGAVGTWGDQSANARSFTQATGANKPTQVASAFGSLPCIRFAASHWLSLASAIALSSGSSFFAVTKWTATTSVNSGDPGSCPLTLVGDRTNGYGSFGATAGVIRSNHYVGGAYLVDRGSGLNDGNVRLIGATYNTTVDTQVYVGSTQQGATDTSGALVGTNTYDTLGAGYGATVQGWNGDVGAIIGGLGVTSSGDITKLYAWAKQRFGAL